VKFTDRHQEQFVFELNEQEKNLLLVILNLFPQVPVSHHRLSQDKNDLPDDGANQRLLEESLKAQKDESQKWVAAMFQEAERFKPGANGFSLTVTRPEIETLLQIFNDVRIGSWLALGSPDLERKKELKLNQQNAPFLQRMELAGLFEMFFLKVIHDQAAGW
jgi:hypothetical protein